MGWRNSKRTLDKHTGLRQHLGYLAGRENLTRREHSTANFAVSAVDQDNPRSNFSTARRLPGGVTVQLCFRVSF